MAVNEYTLHFSEQWTNFYLFWDEGGEKAEEDEILKH